MGILQTKQLNSAVHLSLGDNAGISKPIKAEAVGKKQTRFNRSMSK